jgi:hypothetical protein
MTHIATKIAGRRILVWLIWCIAVLVFRQPRTQAGYQSDRTGPRLGVVSHDRRNGPVSPWQSRYRWKKWALIKYRAWQRTYRQAKRAALVARLCLRGV